MVCLQKKGFESTPVFGRFCGGVLLALLVACALVWVDAWMGQAKAEPMVPDSHIGQVFPELGVQDQFQQPWSVPAQTQRVYFASNRQAGDWMTTLLSEQPENYLASRQSVYLADLSGMPGFVSTMFALPALREQPYRVGVVLDEGKLESWPEDDEAMIVFVLEDGRVASIERIKTLQKLKTSLGL